MSPLSQSSISEVDFQLLDQYFHYFSKKTELRNFSMRIGVVPDICKFPVPQVSTFQKHLI